MSANLSKVEALPGGKLGQVSIFWRAQANQSQVPSLPVCDILLEQSSDNILCALAFCRDLVKQLFGFLLTDFLFSGVLDRKPIEEKDEGQRESGQELIPFYTQGCPFP